MFTNVINDVQYGQRRGRDAKITSPRRHVAIVAADSDDGKVIAVQLMSIMVTSHFAAGNAVIPIERVSLRKAPCGNIVAA